MRELASFPFGVQKMESSRFEPEAPVLSLDLPDHHHVDLR